MTAWSQASTVGLPAPKSWDDYRQGCLGTFGGGYRTQAEQEIFQHGMETVFNLLRAEFPPAELCKAAADLPTRLRALLYTLRFNASISRTWDGKDAWQAAIRLAETAVGPELAASSESICNAVEAVGQ